MHSAAGSGRWLAVMGTLALACIARSEQAAPAAAAPLRVPVPGVQQEPYGELGVVKQQDNAWGDQRGKPRDHPAARPPAWRSHSRTARTGRL